MKKCQKFEKWQNSIASTNLSFSRATQEALSQLTVHLDPKNEENEKNVIPRSTHIKFPKPQKNEKYLLYNRNQF